jgi:Cd2+/Zn2+-exporting ATPase
MAHDYVKDNLQLEANTGKLGLGIVATLAGGILLLCSFAAYFIFESDFYPTVLGGISAILLGGPLILVALRDLAKGHMHMNELVALAVLAAFALGSYHELSSTGTVGGYQEAATIAFFMILSVLIENRTALGARASIESLVRITPTRAAKVEEEGEREVEAKDLRPGDIVRVRPGDNIAADGKVLKGTSTVNQANITGESLPADKVEGDEVFGGTINLTGLMDIEVTKAGQDTTLGRVKDLILQAERTRIPIMRMIDHYAGWYTPTILMVVAIAMWFKLSQGDGEKVWSVGIAMLVIACPCALILATPTAMVAALSSAARLGVLVKSVVDLEGARNLTAMVFDKTGTLTTGILEVTRLTPAPGVEGADLLLAAASVEQHSKHPVAKAVANVARKAHLDMPEPTDFFEVPGQGVSGQIDGQKIYVGRATWFTGDSETIVQLSSESIEAINVAQSSPEADGLSVLFVVRGEQLLGWIGLADNTRPEAAQAIDKLRHLGLKRLIIVTGDRESVAKRVAAQMHTEYKAQVLPNEKLELVDELKSRGHRVAVIGDGVNDAPALAAGDISIAMGAAGSDVAIHSANIALMNNNLNRVPFLIELSRRTSMVIKQNLAIGFFFVVIGMAVAWGEYINAITAAVLHLVSGLVVIFNSARLVRAGESIEYAEADAAEDAADHQSGQESDEPAIEPSADMGEPAPA